MKHLDGTSYSAKEKAFVKYVDLTTSITSHPQWEAIDLDSVLTSFDEVILNRLMETFRIIVNNYDNDVYKAP